jgi:hypothetical protein
MSQRNIKQYYDNNKMRSPEVQQPRSLAEAMAVAVKPIAPSMTALAERRPDLPS